ncbi:SurA N-terminal domain-containing protein [Alphaproteobacteria bacterium]|nr:SurA N-terminal domain-containing protein [Alphaproteobacteria bacterium]
MLRALRNQTQSIFFKIFLVLLICGFALWGVGDLTGGNTSKSILKTNNQNITIERAINDLNRARYSSPTRPSMKETLENGMYNNVLNKLEQEILLNSEGEELELYVPMQVLTRIISDENSFKDPLGKFSQTKFVQSLNNAGLSESKYLEMLKTEANLKQISTPFAINEHYNEKVIKKIIDWQNEIRTIEYDVFPFIDKKNINKPSNKILNEFFEQNKNKYKLPQTRNFQYVEINPSDFQNKITVTEKQIKEKYDNEKSTYITEEKREILQITTQDEQKAIDFVKAVQSNNNFAEVAKDLFKLTMNDINLGFLKKDDLPSTNSNDVFNANLNEIIGPVKSQFGFNVYKINKIIPETKKEYLEVKKEIKDKLIYDLSVETLFEKLDAIEDIIAEGSNISEIASSDIFDKKLSIIEINNISKNGLIYSFNKQKKFFNQPNIFLKQIWDADIGQMSEIFNTNNDTYVLLKVLEENIELKPSYEQSKNLVYKDWLEEELIVKSKENAKQLLFNKNFKFSKNASIKRDSKKLNEINDIYLINQVFDISGDNVIYLNSQNKIIAVKLLNTKIDNYVLEKQLYNQINSSFSKSYFNDFANFFINHLGSKHDLKRNYVEMENILKNAE